MRWTMLESGVVEVEAERGGLPWRCVVAPGDEALARETLGEEAEEVIASWTPEQIKAARLAALPEPSMADLVAAKQAEIRDQADAIMAAIGREYGAYERQTWDQQAAEARALLDSAMADAPLVRAIASARGMDAQDLAGRILANEAEWKRIAGRIIGQRLALQDRLDAATTAEEVGAIEVWYE